MQGVNKGKLILVFIFTLFAIGGVLSTNFYNCGKKETIGFDPYKKILAQVSRHDYFDVLNLIDDYQNNLSEQQILWTKLLVYWDLFQIYDIGYYSALKLQQENYQWYLENSADANQEILVPALYFLANNYYLDGSIDQVQTTIQKGLKYINKDNPLYDRFLIISTPEKELSVNHPDYYYYQYQKNLTPEISTIRNQVEKMKMNCEGIICLRNIDILMLAVQSGLYKEILPIIRSEANFPGTYSQTLSIDNLIVNHIDLRVLLIRKELFMNLYIETLEKLLEFKDSPDFDYFAYERAAWAELLKGNYEDSEYYFKKWLGFLNQNYSGKFLDYQKTHYQALIQVCSDLQTDQYSKRYSLSESDIRDPINVNGSITYNFFYYYMTKNPISIKFFDGIKQRISCFNYPLDKTNPVLETIYIENMGLLIKYFIHDDVSQSAKLILEINEFTRGFDINSLEKLSYANIRAVEIFSLLPYALKNEKYPLDLVSSSYAAARKFPISSIMTNLIAFKKNIKNVMKNSQPTLDN